MKASAALAIERVRPIHGDTVIVADTGKKLPV
jgi:hypothetical protein